MTTKLKIDFLMAKRKEKQEARAGDARQEGDVEAKNEVFFFAFYFFFLLSFNDGPCPPGLGEVINQNVSFFIPQDLFRSICEDSSGLLKSSSFYLVFILRPRGPSSDHW